MRRRQYSSGFSFIDLLFNINQAIFVLFILAILAVSPPAKKAAGVELKAEYIVTLEWPLLPDADVDLWAGDPTGQIVFYRHREANMMFLDRDSQGAFNGITTLEDGTKIKPVSYSETLTLRGIVPGEYVLNAHLFTAFEGENRTQVPRGQPLRVTARMKILKLNPRAELVFDHDVAFEFVGQEVTVTRFSLASDGRWLGADPSPKGLIEAAQSRDSGWSGVRGP